MKFEKHSLCHIPFCYAVGAMPVGGRQTYFFATDDIGPCYAVDARTLARETVWDGPGGTMSIVPLPNEPDAFLASQNFMPGFAAAHARIVKVKRTPSGWTVTPWLKLPYVHRFDLLQRDGRWYFLACILSSTQEEHARRDCPGYLAAAPMSADFAPPAHLEVIARGMARNHGYCRVAREGYDQAYTACDQGVFRVTPPAAPGENWTVEQLLKQAASDVAVCDIDGDGQEELAVIHPFHGDVFAVYHRKGHGYTPCYCYPKPAPFLHAIWGGTLRGKPVFLAGCRAGDKDFFLVEHTPSGLRARLIETGAGPSNVTVLPGPDHDTILIANRESHEAAVFTVTEG